MPTKNLPSWGMNLDRGNVEPVMVKTLQVLLLR